MEQVYWDEIMVENKSLLIAWTERGLCYVGSFIETFEHLCLWKEKYIPEAEVVRYQGNNVYTEQVFQYFNAQRMQFDLPIDLKGTAFQLNVWQQLSKIPYGKTVTYSYIAKEINNPKAVRAVGRAIGQNPVAIVIPCHRVIGKNGTLTGFRGGLEMKEVLLELEKAVVL